MAEVGARVQLSTSKVALVGGGTGWVGDERESDV